MHLPPGTNMAAHPNSEQPFVVHVSDARLDLLRKKLDLVRFPDELEDAGWDYGVPLAHARRLVERWKDGLDWRKSEEEINKLPHFTRDIEVEGFGTLNVHYLHQRSARENAVPLLFVHGCESAQTPPRRPSDEADLHAISLSSAFRRCIRARAFLGSAENTSATDQPSFHVVALSLLGFGFSMAPVKKGFASRQYAEVSFEWTSRNA